ncbi:hypothetical protein [Alkaliphilus oremlandii]|uniref:Uncharacterized protein n=1 Tax=Alkaliphilus oremlandii (strain OhILAs) TaxID=350688 RepID=A8MGQ5_ALKOO|nr:hypothetical protein [Alkaliphilus oremlandii]ABW18599.1 hypothetical protein Clos_1052 [Alkaliphilus oremlandii OhILAs]
MMKSNRLKNKELDLKEMIKAVRNMAEIKQMLFEYGIYDVGRSEKNPGAHVQKTLLEQLADKNNESISFIPSNNDTYSYEGRISIDNVRFFALYTMDELILYAQKRRD